ncbi:hypothetical protein ABZ359_42145 [Streptomyces sp. NPDC005968]|uniref:hypothetical protein n=1 Tax=Streptomyces sp. NPDC005968 TaxID=3154574 RepID=UPI00340C90EF
MDTQVWDALVSTMKAAYTAGLQEGAVPRPVIMPLAGGELDLVWVRPRKVGQDAPTGIAELANIAAAADAFACTPIKLNHPDPFGATAVLMEEDSYSVRLNEAFAR